MTKNNNKQYRLKQVSDDDLLTNVLNSDRGYVDTKEAQFKEFQTQLNNQQQLNRTMTKNNKNWLIGFLQGHLSAAVLSGILLTVGVFAGGAEVLAPEEYKPSTVAQSVAENVSETTGVQFWQHPTYTERVEDWVVKNDGARIYNIDTNTPADDRVWNKGEVITTHYQIANSGWLMTQWSYDNGKNTAFKNTDLELYTKPVPKYDENDNLINVGEFNLTEPFGNDTEYEGDEAWKNFVVRFENTTTLERDGIRLYNINTGQVADDRVWNQGDEITTHYEVNDTGYWMTEYSVLNGIPHGFKVDDLLDQDNDPYSQNQYDQDTNNEVTNQKSEQAESESNFNKNAWSATHKKWKVIKDGVTMYGSDADDRVWNTGDIIETHYQIKLGSSVMTQYSYDNGFDSYFFSGDLELIEDFNTNSTYQPSVVESVLKDKSEWKEDERTLRVVRNNTRLIDATTGQPADDRVWNIGDIITTHYSAQNGATLMTQFSYDNDLLHYFDHANLRIVN